MKLTLFEQFIQEFTYVDEELNPEERQQILQARLTNGKFPETVHLNFVVIFRVIQFFQRKSRGKQIEGE